MKRLLLSFSLILAVAITVFAQVTITLDPSKRGAEIGDLHYGIFFEEINHAGDGGLYAELIRNRSFEDNQSYEYWSVNDGIINNSATDLLNDVQKNCLLWSARTDGYISNTGFWGMKFEAGKEYKFSAFVKSSTYAGDLLPTLIDENGNVIGQSSVTIESNTDWTKYTCVITATGNADKGSFRLYSTVAGVVKIDVVSLFPPTYKGRENGCRPDLAQMLADMKPAFMRFPGGCFIEGEYTRDTQSTNRFEWKKTVGPIEDRPGHQNVNWRYRVSDGLGFHEMLQLSEDLGAKPLFVVNVGLGHGWYQDINDLDEFVQEALDALEYANGDASTKYGAMRIANGHEAPFNLELIEIGNENYNYNAYNNNDQSHLYAERYKIFYDAIKAKYPNVMCIGNVEAWSTDNPSWRNSYPVDAVDEHYYRDPTWFVNAYNKYDNYDRKKMQKVYAGEYAVTSAFGVTGNLAAALGEAVYMQGMENNSDICVMSSYAPIFTHESDYNWKPDMIRFNASESYGTPSYYVQKMMPNYVGKQNVEWTELGNAEQYINKVGLSTWLTSAVFSNYKVTMEDGTVYEPLFDGTSGWASQGGVWTEDAGLLIQDDTNMQGQLYYAPEFVAGQNYTIELDAEKTGGREGFLIAFNVRDQNNYCWWNLGGWNNSQHAVEVCSQGTKRTVASTAGYLENGRVYHLKIEVIGQKVKCYMDNELVHSFSINESKKVYVSSSINDETGKLYVKMVNPSSKGYSTVIKLKDYQTTGGKVIQMASASDKDENDNNNHYNVVPTESTITLAGGQFIFNVPAYSINILELDVEEGASTTNAIYVEPGKYYISNTSAGSYLSRGSDWGTKATFDKVGVPVEIKQSANGYTIRYLDYSNKFLGKDVEPYTDKTSTYPIDWCFVLNDEGSIVLQNVKTKEYIMAGNTIGEGASFTTDIAKATPISFVDAAKYNEQKAAEDASQESKFNGCLAIDVTELVVKDYDMSQSLDGWDKSFSKNPATGSGLTELYEGYGWIQQTLTGLAPDTPYRLTIPAFFRSGVNKTLSAEAENGFYIGTAILYCGGNTKQIKPWAVDRRSSTKPDSMSEAADCFSQGLYQNTIVGYSDANGNMVIGMSLPQYVAQQWLIWGKVKLEQLANPSDYTANIVNPSFEENLTGWDSNMQIQSNSEPSAMKHGSRYCEMWTKEPGHLWDVYARQTVENLPLGKYRLTAACHAENQSGTPKVVSGVYLFAGEERVTVTSPSDYNVFVDCTDGTLDIGFMSEGTDANWVTVDNFRLVWIGSDQDVTIYQKQLDKEIEKLLLLVEQKTILTRELKDEAAAVIAEAQKAESVEEVTAAIDNVKACYRKLDAFRLDVKRSDPYTSYIFAYFPSNSDENLYLAHSLNGFDFTPLNNGQRVMASDTVAIKKGIRDPHILRGVDGKTFYMVATDMRCAQGWDSNRGIVMYKSTDLVHWQHATVHFPDRFPEKWSHVTRVWAPEVIWNPDYVNADGSKGRYMVYFSLLTNDGTCRYDKVFYCHANDDFTGLIEEPIFLYDRGSATIDADIVFDDCDQLYHMIYKNEGSGGICHITARTLTAPEGTEPGSQWGKPSGTIQQTNEAVEGGGLFRLINSNQWVVMYDCYANGHYQFCTTDDWKTYTFKQNTYTSGAFTPRHGTVLPITTMEARRLLEAFPTNGYSPTLRVNKGDVDDDGVVTMYDANAVVNHYLNTTLTPNTEAADVNGDNLINMSDANEIVNTFLGGEK